MYVKIHLRWLLVDENSLESKGGGVITKEGKSYQAGADKPVQQLNKSLALNGLRGEGGGCTIWKPLLMKEKKAPQIWCCGKHSCWGSNQPGML